jgi:hypothetical protein
VSAVIAVGPEDGIGFVALANADSKQPALEGIALLVAQIAFGFGTGNSSSSSSANASIASRNADLQRRTASGVTPRSQSPAALYDIDLAGTYFNEGYGTAVLCSVHSTSPSCQSVLDDFQSIDKSISSNSSDIFFSWITTFSSHIRFAHVNDTQFIIYSGFIYPEGYGKNSTPFSTLSPGGLATFVVENKAVVGLGISGISGVVRTGPVEQASDVWFVKVA